MTGELRPLVIILGPTGVGKTSLPFELALLLKGEIVGADSADLPAQDIARPNRRPPSKPWSRII